MINDWGERFDYTGFHGHPAHCLILKKGNVVICTEAQDNEGTSITNAAEIIAIQVIRFLGLSDMIWIEHYIHEDEETFDLVTFQVEGDHFIHPHWKYLTQKQAMAIFEKGVL